MRQRTAAAFLLLFILGLAPGLLFPAPSSPFAPDECARRRARLMKTAAEGLIVLFGETTAPPGSRFRQDNDLYYLTGVDDSGAVLVLVNARAEAHLFLPEQGAREIMVSGANLLRDEGAAARLRLKSIAGLSLLDEFLARRLAASGSVLYARLAPGDKVDSDRADERLAIARRCRSHFNDYPAPDLARAARLRELFPDTRLQDVSPLLAAMRSIKSDAEIESLRRNGLLTAAAVRQAMRQTRPGAFEYTLEGAAVGWVLGHGARGLAFQSIVAAGLNACTWHYERNDKVLVAGELVLMDFGADLDHLCMDISRTWPVSGTFSPEQREIYSAVLEVQKATIAACRPGADAAGIRKAAAAKLAEKKIDPHGLQGDIHHFVGLGTHDGSPRDFPLQPGMVLTVEPGLYYPEKGIGVRIEDTILITADGCEVLTAAVPKEIAEIEALLRNTSKSSRVQE
jgi:Xaa-Pro aminopeptidase